MSYVKRDVIAICENDVVSFIPFQRRGESETDPIKKARIAQFLKEYWGIKRGGDRKSNSENLSLKSIKDIAKSIGVNEKQVYPILKLNSLIPEIQALVSAGKLGTTAAEQLAYLTEEEQRALVEVFGADCAVFERVLECARW